MNTNSPNEFVLVPHNDISEFALNEFINEFILREGTDYGQSEFSLEEKHAQIQKQLESGKILIVFDPKEQSASMIRKEQFR